MRPHLPHLALALAIGAAMTAFDRFTDKLEWLPAVLWLLLPILFGVIAAKTRPARAFGLAFSLMLAAWTMMLVIETALLFHAPEWEESRILLDSHRYLLAAVPGMTLGFAAGGLGLWLRRMNR